MKVRTRFAPSPTGYMHIGNLRTALYEYLIAKSSGGEFIVRLEDTDRERLVEGADDIIYKTLATTGLKADESPLIGGDYGPYIQSERREIYNEYINKLIESGHAYRCFCTKERLEELRASQEGGISKYDRHCLNLSEEEIQEKLDNNQPFVVRQKTPDEGKASFSDLVYGEISVDNVEIEDQILMKSDGLPTYNFAHIVDDHLMKISHVVRGAEYLSSTPKYNLLYNAFGWEIPKYIHLPPVMKDKSEKLSKRNGDASFEDLVSLGYLPEAIVNYIALLGWSPSGNKEIFSLEELISEFNIDGLSKSPSIFDINKLKWMNSEYIKNMPFEEFFNIIQEKLKNEIKNDAIDLKKVALLIQSRLETINDVSQHVDFFDKLPEYSIDLYTHKKMKTTPEIALTSLNKALEVLSELNDFGAESLHDTLMSLAQDMGIKNGQILWPVRTALSGKPMTPGGAVELAEIFGKDETIARIKKGIHLLNN